MGPVWLDQEIERGGPGDYLVVTPSYPLLERKVLPEFRRYFETTRRLGRYVGSPARRFVFHARGDMPTQVFFGHADDPDSLESATCKAAWLDEAGQGRFKQSSYEAILRRLSLAQGRVLLTTTPYNLGWLYQTLYRPWQRAGGRHAEIDIISFDSITNPVFPTAEFERARASMPPWRFNMFYRGRFERPAGQIYDCFDADRHVVAPFALPPQWPRFVGVDFGGVHTAAVFIAEEPNTDRLYLYREYLEGGRTSAEHAAALLAGEPMMPHAVGGAASEGQWRAEFRAGGLMMASPPVRDVEIGIGRVYGTIKRGELRVFSTCTGVLDQLGSYSRVLDAQYQPTEVIEDKSSYHHLDALRYVCAYLRAGDASSVDAEVARELATFTGW